MRMKKILFTLFAIFSALTINAQSIMKVTTSDGSGSGAYTISDIKEVTFVDETVLWNEDPVTMTWTNVATFEPSDFASCEAGSICRFYTSGAGTIKLFDDNWTEILYVYTEDDVDATFDCVLTADVISTINSASSLVIQGEDITLNKITLIP